MVPSRLVLAAALLYLASFVAAHGGDGHGSMDMDMGVSGMNDSIALAHEHPANVDLFDMPSYSGLSAHSGMIVAHIGFMVAAWIFVLPLGVMFSLSRSRLALPVQCLFLVLNGLGVLFGTIYSINTPDLYENNAHHKVGWVATWIMTAQVAMALIFVYSSRFKKSSAVASSEGAAFLPVSEESMAQHNMQQYSDYRWSGDSGRSSTLNSRDASPTDPSRRESYSKPEVEPEEEDDDDDDNHKEASRSAKRQGFLRITFFDQYLSKHIPDTLSERPLKVLEVAYEVIDRVILILGFAALLSGGITYAGLFRGNNIFNGLAHFVKGGIFFWYGLLTLGRWMGCFADLGWAWNVKPSRTEVGQWKASLPSAEFVESFVIWLYGSTNVFLEHLAAWGDVWTAQDLEHVSISIMFFGGGLCGMLIESKKIRRWLNTSVDVLPPRRDVHPTDGQATRSSPKTYAIPMNPIPALIILLLGIMMSSHHQDSMVSTKVHAQWGTLLVGFAFARGVTYILTYISPPTSVFPNRPPSELISSFCLISGGLLFMASTKDIIHVMEVNNLMAMFLFTVMMGFTAFLMAWTIIVLALKGWAVRKELHTALSATY